MANNVAQPKENINNTRSAGLMRFAEGFIKSVVDIRRWPGFERAGDGYSGLINIQIGAVYAARAGIVYLIYKQLKKRR